MAEYRHDPLRDLVPDGFLPHLPFRGRTQVTVLLKYRQIGFLGCGLGREEPSKKSAFGRRGELGMYF